VRLVMSSLRSDFTLDEESVNYDKCSKYFWTKTKRYKTVGNCITMLGCGKQCKKLLQTYQNTYIDIKWTLLFRLCLYAGA